MGRPLKKSLFGDNANSIKCRVKIGTNAEADGHILKQVGSKRFKVTDGTNTGVCTLADAAQTELADNQMNIEVKDDTGAVHYVVKIASKKATLENGTTAIWSFSDSTADEEVEIEDVVTDDFDNTGE